MKSVSLVLALSLFAPAAFAQTNIADRVTKVDCTAQSSERGQIQSIVRSNGEIVLVAGYGEQGQEKASVYSMTFVSLAAGDQEGLTIMATGADGDLDLILDVQGKAQFYKLNGEIQDTKDLSCKIDLKK